MGLFDGFRFTMTDATVPNPDYSEAELDTIEPEENATKEEKDEVDFEATGAEAFSMLKINRNRVKSLRNDLAKKINKLARLYKAINADSSLMNGRLTASMRTILMEEEIIGPETEDDAKEAAKESSPEEIADKGASEEELAKASLRAQHRAYKKIYTQLKNF